MQVRNDSLANSLLAAINPPIGGKVGKSDSVNLTEGLSAPSAADKAKDRAEAAKASQRAQLDEVRKKGIYAWAQEQRFEKLKARIREQVTSANPDADPVEIEQEITRQVREAIEQALKDEASAAAKRGEPPKPMIIDITV
jgi:hypothetical protein